MPKLTESLIQKQLQHVIDPYSGQPLLGSKAIQQVTIDNGKINVTLCLGYPPEVTVRNTLCKLIQSALNELSNVSEVNIDIRWKCIARVVQPGLKAIPEVKNVIAIASGKGGVGKSTTAVNLALGLVHAGARVGILDADIYGPNQPHMLGVTEKPVITSQKKFKPVLRYGLQTMSIGYLVETSTPTIWRGPMVSGALTQLANDTLWDALDYLIIDLPPGTGDIQLTLVQKVPVSGAVIVTTPQDISLLDARKGLEMFRKVKVPVLGIVENMSGYICLQCGHEEPLFGKGGGERIAQACGVPLLGQLPLMLMIREAVDIGCPTVIADPESVVAKTYIEIALKIAAHLTLQPINYAAKFPKIVVEGG